MSSSVVPGCAAMKYGMRYCSLPASREYRSNSSLNRPYVPMPGFIMCASGPASVCSGAIFRYPPVWCCASSRTYSGDRTARS